MTKILVKLQATYAYLLPRYCWRERTRVWRQIGRVDYRCTNQAPLCLNARPTSDTLERLFPSRGVRCWTTSIRMLHPCSELLLDVRWWQREIGTQRNAEVSQRSKRRGQRDGGVVLKKGRKTHQKTSHSCSGVTQEIAFHLCDACSCKQEIWVKRHIFKSRCCEKVCWEGVPAPKTLWRKPFASAWWWMKKEVQELHLITTAGVK